MREYKVYGGLIMMGKKQRKTILATRTKKKALELLEPFGITAGHFRDFWNETGNETELKVALAEPETIFVSWADHSLSGKEFVKLEE